MKIFFYGLVLLSTFNFCYAQKKSPITNESYKSWRQLSDNYTISSNGKYILYTVNSYPNSRQTFLYNIANKSTHLYGNIDAKFSIDGNAIVYLKQDTLVTCQLEPYLQTEIKETTSNYNLIKAGNTEFAIVLTRSGLDIEKIRSGEIVHFDGIKDFKINEQGSVVAVKTDQALGIIELPKLKYKKLIEGNIENLPWTFDLSGNNMAVMVGKNKQNFIYLIRIKSLASQIIVDSRAQSMNGMLLSEQYLNFSPNGQKLYFKIIRPIGILPTIPDEPANIWGYNDRFVGPRGEWRNKKCLDQFLAVKCLSPGSKITQLENDSLELSSALGNKYILLHNIRQKQMEAYFRKDWMDNYKLVEVSTGKTIKDNILYGATLSPAEKYIICRNREERTISLYNIESGKVTNLVFEADVNSWQENDRKCIVRRFYLVNGIYKSADIEVIDPVTGRLINDITQEYGKKNNIVFDFALNYQEFYPESRSNDIILKGLDSENKEDGLYSARKDGARYPQKLITEKGLIASNANFLTSYPVRRSANGSVFLYVCQSSSESPNLYFTRDFKTITKVTDIHPEIQYNWLTSELINYPKNDGTQGQAVVYKPENFDPQKKYPVLFYYYQEATSGLYAYLQPALSIGVINIPWYVSNGYVVCIPNIINLDGKKHAVSTVNSVEGAANYLKQFNWVDSTHMGIQGHSFGGYETGLLATKSHLFAAAQPSSGAYNLISERGQFGFDNPLDSFVENGQSNMGGSLWDYTEAYLKNSPILYANNVSTPILIMHGNNDDIVPFAQAVEFITALRRLHKPSWLLEYNAGHSLRDNEAAQLDFTIRQQQFFGHYLKGEPMPDWMK